MNKLAILLSLVALTIAQEGADYNPAPGEEYHPEQKVAPKETVVKHETVVVKPVVVKPVHHTIGAEARRVNHINGYRQHYVNRKAVHHGASAGTAPEYGVPGTGFHDGGYYDGGYYDGYDGYDYGGYRRGYRGGY